MELKRNLADKNNKSLIHTAIGIVFIAVGLYYMIDKINQLYVQIIESNLVSRKLFENDYELHGKLKNWIKTPANYEDVLTYQKFRKI